MSATSHGPSSEAKARAKAQALAEADEYRQAYRRDKAKSQTVGNLVFATVVCLVVVAFLMIVTWRPKDEKVRAIAYTAQLQDARKAAAWVRGPDTSELQSHSHLVCRLLL